MDHIMQVVVMQEGNATPAVDLSAPNRAQLVQRPGKKASRFVRTVIEDHDRRPACRGCVA